ncbi:MAG: glycerol-3-phosphate responsive antiterminator [Pirellulaceae bacterium]|nr:glycerol-3-phosphate responsive antiterminator [Pirellulaceae bacterium]
MKRRRTRLTMDDCLVKKIIPYVEGGVGDSADLLAKASMVFLQAGELADIPEMLEPFQRPPLAKVAVMLHLDLVHGLARDEAALRYVAELDRLDGIITVHHHLVGPARRHGLLSVVRLFIQDTRAVGRGIGVIEKSMPDAVEMLPSVAAIEVADRFRQLHIPRIAGGLIYNLNVIQRVLDAGCRAASTSNRELWGFNDR